jgi:hypothetical protein
MIATDPSRTAELAPKFSDARRSDAWRHSQIYLHTLLIFAASRAAVAVGAGFGAMLPQSAPPWPWDPGNAWYTALLRWDSAWFATTLDQGYRYSDDPTVQSSTEQFPLYILASYLVKALFGINAYLALFLIANAAAVAVAVLMTKFVKDELGGEAALPSVALFCFFPFSLFLSAGYSESLCLTFILLSLILLRRSQFVLAAAAAGLAVATRSAGIVLLPVILLEMWRRDKLPWFYLAPKMALVGLLALSGLVAFMIYLGVAFGHPFAFVTSHAAWEGGTLAQRFAWALTLGPFHNFDFARGGWFVCFVLLTIWSLTRLRFATSLYALGALAFPYFTIGITGSMNRYLLACFPVFMAFGLMCRGRPWLTGALIGVFAAMLATNTALFSRWYWMG